MMEQLLDQEDGLSYLVSDSFQGEMLAPVIQNLLHKAQHSWDDYNEVYHCCQLIQTVRRSPKLHMQLHTVRRGADTIGLGLVTRGEIACPLFFPQTLMPPEPQEQLLVFNYFHVCPQERGIGGRWLGEIILPHYRDQGYRAMYVKSSHPKVFSLYGRLGREVGTYTSSSDNQLHTREGRLFRLPLDESLLCSTIRSEEE